MNKIRRMAIYFLLILILSFGTVHGAFGGKAITGNDLNRLCTIKNPLPNDENVRTMEELLDTACLNFVQGTINGWQIGMVMATNDVTAPKKIGRICIPDSSNADQWHKITMKWFRDHPEKLHIAASALVIFAIKEAFPCKGQ